MTGDHDDWHLGAICDELLQVETAELRKSHIQDQATWSTDSRTSQEVFGRREGLRPPPGEANAQLQGLTH